MTTADWTGFAGVGLLLMAFFLNVRGIIEKDSRTYLWLNISGAGLACLASVLLEYVPFIILEGCWMIVSVYGLVRVMRVQNENRGTE